MRSAGVAYGVLPTWEAMQQRYDEAFAAWDAAGRPDHSEPVPPQQPVASAPVKGPPSTAKEPIKSPANILEFNQMFPDEGACTRYLFRVRWPDGFVCPKCGATKYYEMKHESGVVQCLNHHRTSATAGTAMHGSKVPLLIWFHAAYLLSTLTPGFSARQFQRELGISCYETAFNLLHKLRASLVDPEREPLHGDVEVDDAYVGGPEEGRPGRGSEKKAIIVVAVEAVRWLDTSGRKYRDKEPGLSESFNVGDLPRIGETVRVDGRSGTWRRRAGRIRMAVIPDVQAQTLVPWVAKNVAKEHKGKPSYVFTDGWASYNGLGALGYNHVSIPASRGRKPTGNFLPLVHLIISNLKTWLQGTHKGAVSPKHLQAYLNEFTFRFNRRFWMGPAFLRALGLVTHATTWPEYDTLYAAGTVEGWHHPNPQIDAAAFFAVEAAAQEQGEAASAWMATKEEEVRHLIESAILGKKGQPR